MVLRLTADAVSLSVVRFFCGYTFQFFLLTLLSWSTLQYNTTDFLWLCLVRRVSSSQAVIAQRFCYWYMAGICCLF